MEQIMKNPDVMHISTFFTYEQAKLRTKVKASYIITIRIGSLQTGSHWLDLFWLMMQVQKDQWELV